MVSLLHLSSMSNALVIIPTYNEIENISKMLDTVMNLNEGFDVLIVDDGSPDGTAQVVREKMDAFGGRIHLESRTGKLGLGTAYIHGFKWALARGYEYIFEMDCDFSHDPNDLARLKKACEDGADLSIGSRYVKGVNVVNWPMSRVLLSYFASVYVRFITGMPEELVNEVCMFLGAHRKALSMVYPPGGFIGWHNNANAGGYNIIFTWSEKGDGQWEHIDPITKEHVVIPDVEGWQCKYGYYGTYDEYDKILYHAARTNCLRSTIAFVFNSDETGKRMAEHVVEEIQTA